MPKTAPEAAPIQFPEIEKLLETEDFSRINANFQQAYEALEKMSRGRGGMGKSRDARKAMKAIERVMDLLRDLLKLKYQLKENGGLSQEGDVSPPRRKR